MRIGFYFNASHLNNFSITQFKQGNLGISGTDSSFFRVVSGLAKRKEFDVYLFAKNVEEEGFSELNFTEVSEIEQAINLAKEEAIDIFIFNDLKNPEKTNDVLELAENIGLSLVVWAQNPVQTLDSYAKSKAVLKIVYVESFDLNQIRHKDAFYKGVVIPNGVERGIYTKRDVSIPDNLNVIYLGSLTPGKGFHYLAKAWPKVLLKVPTAKLLVIGSGKLYNNYAKLGPLGIADEEYEKELVPYIGHNKEELKKNNVECYGLLNRNEVINLIYNSKVACINPNIWGSLESCSVSSLEIQLCGVPVIAGKAGGNLNTIINKKTGLLIKNHEAEFPAAIIQLLENDELNLRMRKAAREYILNKYELNLVIHKWVDFLQKVKLGQSFSYPKITQELAEGKLFVKEGIRIFKRILGK